MVILAFNSFQLLQNSLKKHLFHYRHILSGAVRQERSWFLRLACILKIKFVGARCRRVLNLDKVLIVPGGQAVIHKFLLYLVGQSLVAGRTSLVIPMGKLAASGKNEA